MDLWNIKPGLISTLHIKRNRIHSLMRLKFYLEMYQEIKLKSHVFKGTFIFKMWLIAAGTKTSRADRR